MQDQLVDDAKLNLVMAYEPHVVVFVAIKSDHLAFRGVLFESIGQQDAVGAVVPLHDFCPLHEEINSLVIMTFIVSLPLASLSLVPSNEPSPMVGIDMRRPHLKYSLLSFRSLRNCSAVVTDTSKQT